MNPLAALRQGLVRVIAALCAGRGSRQPGRGSGNGNGHDLGNSDRSGANDAAIPAMLALAPVLAMPVFVVLLGIVRVATQARPLRREPLLPLAVDSLVVGAFIAASLVTRWRPAVDAVLAAQARRTPGEQLRSRVLALVALLLVAAAAFAGVRAFVRQH